MAIISQIITHEYNPGANWFPKLLVFQSIGKYNQSNKGSKISPPKKLATGWAEYNESI